MMAIEAKNTHAITINIPCALALPFPVLPSFTNVLAFKKLTLASLAAIFPC